MICTCGATFKESWLCDKCGQPYKKRPPFEIIAEFDAMVAETMFPEGAQVKANDTVIILNCLKMMFQLKTPNAGIVHYFFDTDDYVMTGDVLARIE